MADKRSGAVPVHLLKITLLGIRPPVWRRVVVPSSTSLAHLHTIIQVVMDWWDEHLHLFRVDGAIYGPAGLFDDGWGPRAQDEGRAKLSRVAPAGSRFVYEYDFGDSWEHEVVVEKVERVAADGPGASGPRCLSGRRACPPEDCGGVWGYAHLVEAVANPTHERHAELVEWLGGPIDPDHFDLEAINAAMARFGRRGRQPAVARR